MPRSCSGEVISGGTIKGEAVHVCSCHRGRGPGGRRRRRRLTTTCLQAVAREYPVAGHPCPFPELGFLPRPRCFSLREQERAYGPLIK